MVRAFRIRWYLQGLGHPIALREAFLLNAWGDAGAGLTPMRLGGEAARLAGILRAGVPAPAAFMAIGVEVVVAYPVVFLFGGWLFWRFAPDWWAHAAPSLRSALAGGWPWALGMLVLTLMVWMLATRWKHFSFKEPRRGVGRVRNYWREMKRWPIATGIPASLGNVAARTMMLPVLALTLPDPPPFGVMLVGSFALLYSQLVLPTPAGAGAVDLGFLGGVAGDLGPREGALLVAWRFYTVGAGAILGVGFAVHAFGLRPLIAAIRSASRRPEK